MYAGLLNNEVIILEETYRQYPPDALGTPVETVECDDTVTLGMIYEPDSGTFREREKYDRLVLSPKDLTHLLNVAIEYGHVIIRVPRTEVSNER